jgi:rubrerythrin
MPYDDAAVERVAEVLYAFVPPFDASADEAQEAAWSLAVMCLRAADGAPEPVPKPESAWERLKFYGTNPGFWLAQRLPMRVALWYGRKQGWICRVCGFNVATSDGWCLECGAPESLEGEQAG